MSALQGYESESLVSFEDALEPLASIVPGIEQMIEVVIEKCNQLTDDDEPFPNEPAAIVLYALKWKTPESSFKYFLNKTLRSQNRQELRPWFLYIRLFISALSQLSSITSRTVYRGLSMNVNEEYAKGNTVIWHDFASCTSSIDHAEDSTDDNESRMIFIIECDSAKDISGYSFDENNKEIVLYPERQFEVVASLNYGIQLKFIQLKEIRQNSPLIDIPQTPYSRRHGIDPLISFIEQFPENQKRIDLTDGELVDKQMKTIVQHTIDNKKFQQVILSKNKFTLKGSSILAKALNDNDTLIYLSLSYNDLSDKGVQCLTKVLARNNSKLERLSLHETGITDQSVPYIADMLTKNTTLTWLYLGGNKISDQSMDLLTSALIHDNQTLKALDLSHNKLITNASMDYLSEMLKTNTSLETFWINNCGISPEEKAKLQKIVQEHRRFFLLFVDDTPNHILAESKSLIENGKKLSLGWQLHRQIQG